MMLRFKAHRGQWPILPQPAPAAARPVDPPAPRHRTAHGKGAGSPRAFV